MSKAGFLNRILGGNANGSYDEGQYGGSSNQEEVTPSGILDEPARSSTRLKPSRQSIQYQNGNIFHGNTTTGEEEEEDTGEMRLLDIVTQLIPYYGQGNASNDSNLRAALSGLSIEDIDSKDEYGNTLLILACSYRCEDLVRIMLNKGADPNASNSTGTTCLHFACHKDTQSNAIAKALLLNGATPDVHELQYGCTPLHYCAASGNLELSKLLISKGAQINAIDYYNYKSVDYARDGGFTELTDYLQQKTIESNKTPTGHSPYDNTFSYPTHTPMMMTSSSYNNNEWQRYVDPSSGYPYYLSNITGEALWEADYQQRIQNNTTTANGAGAYQSHMFINTMMMESPTKHNMMMYSSSTISPQKSSSSVLTSSLPMSGDSSTIPSPRDENTTSKPSEHDKIKALRHSLLSLYRRYDPNNIQMVDKVVQENKGNEINCLKDICTKFQVNENIELAKYHTKLKSITHHRAHHNSNANRATSLNNIPGVTPVASESSDDEDDEDEEEDDSWKNKNSNPNMMNGAPKPMNVMASMSTNKLLQSGSGLPSMNQLPRLSSMATMARLDPHQLQSALAEERVKYEQLLKLEKEKFEHNLNDEKIKFTTLLSEKDMKLTGLQNQIDSLTRDKNNLKNEVENMQSSLSTAQSKGGEAMTKKDQQIVSLQHELSTLKQEFNETTTNLHMQIEKYNSLELTLQTLASGNEERIQKEQEASKERERIQREREEFHQKELTELEQKLQKTIEKHTQEINTLNNDIEKKEKQYTSSMEELKKKKDNEMDKLRLQFGEERIELQRKISLLTLDNESMKKEKDEALQRAIRAEDNAKSLQNEVMEARSVQALNAQLHKDLAREQQQRKRLHNEIEDMKGRIRVYIRIRPLSRSELEKGCNEATYKDGKLAVTVKGVGGQADAKKTFDFDQIFGGKDGNTQTDVFRDTKHLVMSVLDGYNVCIFAYGQTGAGKSYTMIGASDIGTCLQENGDFDAQAGITPRAVSELFRLLNERQAQLTYEVEVQMFQLYRDNIDDLLADKKNKSKKPDEDNTPLKIILAEFSDTGLVQVQGAEILTATTPADVMRIFAKGSSRRTTASTQMNLESSRSHLICSLLVKMTNRRTGQLSMGKLTLVDLAGSERVDKSGATGDVLKEAQSINKSLSALGDVIAALTSGQSHVPYRNHPLTMLMSDTIGGNSKTLIFINASPADYNISETVSSFNFGTRCKDITNSVSTGPGVQLAQVNALKKELNKLKKQGGGPPGGPPPGGPPPTSMLKPSLPPNIVAKS